MKALRVAGWTLVFGCWLATQADAADLSDLYSRAKETLGTKERTILASGASRLIVWKSDSPNELMLMSITGLYKKPENFSSSFTAYSLSDSGMFSNKIYQCSWREENQKIVYECGETMKFPAGIREMASNELIRELDAVLRASQQPTDKELTAVRSR